MGELTSTSPTDLIACAQCPTLPFDAEPRFFVAPGEMPAPRCPSCHCPRLQPRPPSSELPPAGVALPARRAAAGAEQ